jgi:hypothetical protein
MSLLRIIIFAILINTSLFFQFLFSVNWNDPFTLEKLSSLTADEAKKEIEPLIDGIGSGLNSGFYSPVQGKIFSIGLQANVVQLRLKDQGILKQTSLPALPLPFLYAGMRIPSFKINLFIRASLMPYNETSTMKILGLGGGWESNFLPTINTKFLIHYHMANDFPFMNSTSLGGSVIATYTKLPVVSPYTIIGLNNTEIKINNLKIENRDFSHNKSNLLFGLGIKVFNYLTLEANLAPILSSSISIGFSI